MILRAIAAIAVMTVCGPGLAHAGAAPSKDIAEIRNFVLTDARTRAFGEQKPVANPVVVETVHVYGEPQSFGWHSVKGAEKFNVLVDLELRKRSDGTLVAELAPRSLVFEAPSRPRNFFFAMSLDVGGRTGAYDLVVQLRDEVSGKVVKKSFPITIAKLESTSQPEPEARNSASPQTVASGGSGGQQF